MSDQIVWPKRARAKICPRCGEPLTCGPEASGERCWCDARLHVALSTDFGDCLCPACLDDEIAKTSARAAD